MLPSRKLALERHKWRREEAHQRCSRDAHKTSLSHLLRVLIMLLTRGSMNLHCSKSCWKTSTRSGSGDLEREKELRRKDEKMDVDIEIEGSCEGGGGGIGVEDSDAEKKGRTRMGRSAQVTRNVVKHVEGERVAAGWPSWLVVVAGEATNGLVPRRADTFEKLDKNT